MHNDWTAPGTPMNHTLRVVCVWLMLAGQCAVWSGGCNQGSLLSPGQNVDIDGRNDNQDTGDNGDNSDVDGSMNDSNVDDSNATPDALAIDGYWISTRDADGAVLEGLATIGRFGDTVTITIAEDDGGGWDFNGQVSGSVFNGTCSPALTTGDVDISSLFGDPLACRGDLSNDGAALTLTAREGDMARVWKLRKPAGPVPKLTGSWTEAVSGDGLICAYDGRTLSVLNPADTYQRFDAQWNQSGGFVGNNSDGERWIGLPDNAGQELFVWIEGPDASVTQRTYARNEDPPMAGSPLTGRWMSSYNNGAMTNALHGQAEIIFDGTYLYVHQRDDSHRVLYESDYAAGGYWSIFATSDGRRFQSTSESTTKWSGYVDATGTTIYGHWSGDETASFGFTRVDSPDPADLSGTWTSVSTDYETPSTPAQSIGRAHVTYDGTTLRIEDTYDEADYVIDALWTGDHFEGNWWPSDDPDNRLQWSGEVVLDGALLHGKWEYGEWSFSPYAVESRTALADVATDTLTVVSDPFDDMLAAFRDTGDNLAVTVYRHEGIVDRYSIVAPAGQVDMQVDERSRPTKVTGPDLNVSLNWADDSSSVELAISENGTTFSETVNLDLSDEALRAALTTMENATGVDAAGLRAWLDANPGRVQAVVEGREVVASSESALSRRASGVRTAEAKDPTSVRVLRRVVTDGATIAGLIWGAVAAGSKYLLATSVGTASVTVATAFGGLALLAITATGVILGFFLADFIFSCYPCSLSCFWNCFE